MFIYGGEEGIIFWNYNPYERNPDNIFSINIKKRINNSRLNDDRIIIKWNKEGSLKVFSICKMDIINYFKYNNIWKSAKEYGSTLSNSSLKLNISSFSHNKFLLSSIKVAIVFLTKDKLIPITSIQLRDKFLRV